jgi:hypothetical protein
MAKIPAVEALARTSRRPFSLRLRLPEQLRQSGDVDGDAPGLVFGQHLGLAGR